MNKNKKFSSSWKFAGVISLFYILQLVVTTTHLESVGTVIQIGSVEAAAAVPTSSYSPDLCGLDVIDCPNELPNQIVYGYSSSVTAYSELETCKSNCIMASGKKAYIGAIACPRNINLGTRVVIDNISYICEDRTNVKYNGRYDIFYGYGESAYNQAIKYGIKIKQVKVFSNM